MYIRRTQTCNTASGERYYTYRLVESKRVEGKVKQITRLNLGRHFDVGQDHWPALCARIEELLQGQAPLVPVECPATVERHAQRIAAQLIARQASLRSSERFWDIRVPKIDSIFDNSLVPRPSWSPGVPPQHRKLVAATHRSPI